MSALFAIESAYSGDPTRPDMATPTPPEIVARLTRPQREVRVTALIDQAHQIITDALDTHTQGRAIVARCILFSGGNDSTILGHLFKDRATHAIHANTTIGIEQTRQFVRDTCKTWGLPLIEETAPITYRDLVVDQGFPGPGMHWKMYQRLKERPLRQARRRLITGPHQRVLFLAGRRRQESDRRADIPLHERDGSVIWASPLAMWTRLDMNTYRLMAGDVPANPVSDLLHMSGECLCGAFARPGELDEVRQWFPDTAAEIDSITSDVRAAGWAAPVDEWGHGRGVPSKSGRLCSSCRIPGQGALDLDAIS